MTEGIGFYCGIAMRWFRDAFCELETAEAARRGVDPYVVMEEAAARVPPGSERRSSAIFSNVMDAKRWVQASPSFLGFDVDRPAALEPAWPASGRSRSRPPTPRAATSRSSRS